MGVDVLCLVARTRQRRCDGLSIAPALDDVLRCIERCRRALAASTADLSI